MATVPAAFPFVEVKIDTSALAPVAQRSPGVIAIVGKSDSETGAPNTPIRIDTLNDAQEKFTAPPDTLKNIPENQLYRALKIALLQDPKPSKIYAVKVEGTDYITALESLEAADDVTFVSLAGEPDINALLALKNHVEEMSSNGQKRLGVAMVDPDPTKPKLTVTQLLSTGELEVKLRSDASRMVLVAARGATASTARNERGTDGKIKIVLETYVADVATAAMASIAGYDPYISVVLKKIRGFSMPLESQYGPTEIKELSEAGIIPIIDPALIVGESLHFAEGRCFTKDANLLYIDIVRVLDDIDFRLKAGLIGAIGDARITKAGMTVLKTRVEGILGPLKRSNVIVDFGIDIPVLNILGIPESTWNPTDQTIVQTARANRIVDLFVSITYGPAVHQLKVTLAPKF